MKTSTLKHTSAKLFLPVLWCCVRYGKLRPFSQKNACTIVCSLVLSKLDYCNTLYYNINNSEHNLLQSVQNAAIRLIGGRFKYDRVSISPLFEQLHWLRIEELMVFKICLIVHKCVWGLAPEALKAMVEMSNPRTLNLVEKKFRSAYGKRAFSCAGPKLWNNLVLSHTPRRRYQQIQEASQVILDE